MSEPTVSVEFVQVEGPELGNLLFGNSRGAFPVVRGEGFEEELRRLFDAYAPERDNRWREYGVEFENATFAVFPYYWGDCMCGYEDIESAWHEEHAHASDCFYTRREAFERNLKERVKWLGDKYVEEVARWARDNGFPSGWEGCAGHCTCTYHTDWAAFAASCDHKPDCPIIRPNFLYKPDGFTINWYKYPLRDSYFSREISLPDFKAMIDTCIKSLLAPPTEKPAVNPLGESYKGTPARAPEQ